MTPKYPSIRTRRHVLDANALIALFEDREGIAGRIEHLLEQALEKDLPLLMSAVNWGEVFYVTWHRHGETTAHKAESKLRELPITVIDVDRQRASRAGAIKQKHGLGYADAFAAELAIERGARLVTADPEFAKVGEVLAVYSLPRHNK